MAPRLRLIPPWPALAAGLALGALAASSLPPALLQWEASTLPSQAWRWFSAALVHLSAAHLGANLAGCAVVGAFGLAARLSPRWAVAWAVAWPLTHASLGLVPGLSHYAGLSGVLHAGVAVAAVGLLAERRGVPRAIGAAVLAGTVLKVLAEAPWAAPVQTVAGWDFPVAVVAHATGLLSGILCGLLCAWGGSYRGARDLEAGSSPPGAATRPAEGD